MPLFEVKVGKERVSMRFKGQALASCTLLCCCVAFGSEASDPSLPVAKDVVARYDEALGGRSTILRHTSSTMRGTYEVHEAGRVVTLPFVYYASAPYRRIEIVSLPGNAGEVLNGFDGEIAWSFDQRTKTAQVFDGDDRESMKRDADFYYPLDELSWFKSMETVAIEDFEGRPCYRLHGINNWNKANDHFYDRETGLLAGYEFDPELGPTHEIFSDYKRVDGVLVPMRQTVKTKSKSGGWTVRSVLTYASVTFNDVDPAVFAPPQAVRDLLAKRNGGSHGAGGPRS
jgi:hypothetical protein